MAGNEYSITRNCVYIVISLIAVFVLAMIIMYLPQTRDIDFQIIHALQGAVSYFPVTVPQFISEFGGANYWLWPRITAATVMISHKNYVRAFLFIIITQAIFLFNNCLLKTMVCRERPYADFTGYSFPSGHCSFGMCFWGILIYLTYRYVRTDWWRTVLITLFTLWIILIGISRMWLGAHFLTDVIAGYFVGFAFVNLYIILDKFFSK